MHKAFEIESVADGLKIQSPTSLFVHSDQLLLGTSDGTLLVYSIINNTQRINIEDQDQEEEVKHNNNDEDEDQSKPGSASTSPSKSKKQRHK